MNCFILAKENLKRSGKLNLSLKGEIQNRNIWKLLQENVCLRKCMMDNISLPALRVTFLKNGMVGERICVC